MIAKCEMHQILVDNKSFADILYMDMFENMNIGKDKLGLIKIPPMVFRGESVIVKGVIQLPVSIEEALVQVMSVVDFLVIDCPSFYNMIVGRPFLKPIKAVMSTYALVIKFPVGSRVDTVREEQRTARETYALIMKNISPKVSNLPTLIGKHKNRVLCLQRKVPQAQLAVEPKEAIKEVNPDEV